MDRSAYLVLHEPRAYHDGEGSRVMEGHRAIYSESAETRGINMATEYDPQVLQTFADVLYSKAKSIVVRLIFATQWPLLLSYGWLSGFQPRFSECEWILQRQRSWQQ
jgi:hypothetical protein